MKAIAASLLVVAAALYVLSVVAGDGHGAWGYLQAATEAAMVGGLADWFAVTALFRRPLGLPIPHTAIIPRKKDQIGASLGAFVQQNFLNSAVVSERLASAQVPLRVGSWLAEPAHADRVSHEAASLLHGATAMLRDDDLRAAIAGYVEKRLRDVDLAAPLSRVIDAVCDSGEHQVALAAGLRGLARFLAENRVVLRQRLSEESPEWVPQWIDDKLFARLFNGLQSFLAEVAADDQHELRRQFDRYLRDYAEALRTDPAKAASVELAKLKLLEHPDVRTWLSNLWEPVKRGLLAGAADPGSELRRTISSLVMQLGGALRDDETLRAKVDGWLERAVSQVLARYADELAGLISSTVQRWDADETGRRLELQVGRDLQFIRINGTVVGALVGVLIHAVSQLL